MRLHGLVALAILAATHVSAQTPANIKATTNSGVLVGQALPHAGVFKGVPFAQPPLGALRWSPPQPIKWSGEKQATAFALPCLQTTNPDGRPNGAGVSGPS